MKTLALIGAFFIFAAPAAAQTQSRLPDFKPLMQKQGPAVVNVITTRKPSAATGGTKPPASDDPMLEFFRRFAPDAVPERGQPPRQGLASGFIISKDGYVITNAHVVAGFDDVLVRLADAKQEFKAKVVGADRRTDIALLKIDGRELPVVTLGDSSKVEPGEWVAAIGSPFGFANTITAGIVSAKGRSLPDDSYVPFLQTDVAINPGNSGGPLLNLQGEVVGVNSMIYSGTGGYMGVSFAIPIEVALDVAKQIRTQGKVVRGRVGIAIQPLTKELAQSFKLDKAAGAVVVNVEPDGPADKAGLKVGDVVLAWNGKPIEDPNELPRVVAATKPGSEAKIEVFRDGKRRELKVLVGEIQSEVAETAAERGSAPQTVAERLGLKLRELPPSERRALGIDYGLVVTEVTGGPAQASPILPGDVIIAVNQTSFRSLAEFNKLIDQRKKGESVALLVRRGEMARYIPLPIG